MEEVTRKRSDMAQRVGIVLIIVAIVAVALSIT